MFFDTIVVGSVIFLLTKGNKLQVVKLQEEFFLPGEIVMEQGNAVDQLYFVSHGVLVS